MSFIKYFQPKRADRAGILPTFLQSVVATITANATTTGYIATPKRKLFIERASISSSAVPADADGTILFKLLKYDASADADVTLVNNADLETLITNETQSFALTLVSGLTAAQRTLDEGDTLRWTIVSNSAAFNTAPANVCVAVEALVRE